MNRIEGESAHGFEHPNRLRDDLSPDTVSRDHCDRLVLSVLPGLMGLLIIRKDLCIITKER